MEMPPAELEYHELLEAITRQNKLLESILNRLTVLEAQRLENERLYLENQRRLIELLENRYNSKKEDFDGFKIFEICNKRFGVKLNRTDTQIIEYFIKRKNGEAEASHLVNMFPTKSPNYIYNRLSLLHRAGILQRKAGGRKYRLSQEFLAELNIIFM